MKELALRLLLVLVLGLAALGTAPAYLHFAVGAVAGFDGVREGRYVLGPLLSMLSVLAAFALWRVWLICGRLWRDGAYVNVSLRDRSYDAAGLGATVAAVIGFLAIAKAIHRADVVIFFGILLVPAAFTASIAFFVGAFAPRADAQSDAPASPSRSQLADLPGLVIGTAAGLLGVYFLVPRPRSGWGPCDFTVFYPLHSELWPVEPVMMFDNCATDAITLSIVSGVLSLICLAAGALAAAIGRNANAARGARAAAIVVAVVLTTLAIQRSDTPDAPYLGWLESFIAGALIVVGAGWLGFVGGIRGARWNPQRVG
ncbi:MAG TPA: hypothetical protein VJS12_21005 [Steroidobacteraceae bacterium]|nr:hypothetical protein [Steroidobacteraceae bacterium]